MKTIRMWADIYSTGLFMESGEWYDFEETTISKETWNELIDWVDAYDFIISLSSKERNKIIKKINELDKWGLELMDKISKEWSKDIETGEPLQFKYYSEGLLKYLS